MGRAVPELVISVENSATAIIRGSLESLYCRDTLISLHTEEQQLFRRAISPKEHLIRGTNYAEWVGLYLN